MNSYTDVLKKYAVFQGRASRKEYWTFILINAVVSFVVLAITIMLHWWLLVPVFYLYQFAIILPSLGVTVRRLHDTGKSGWWFFITFVPFIGSIILLILTLQEGQAGDNQWGPNPIVATVPVNSNPTPQI